MKASRMVLNQKDKKEDDGLNDVLNQKEDYDEEIDRISLQTMEERDYVPTVSSKALGIQAGKEAKSIVKPEAPPKQRREVIQEDAEVTNDFLQDLEL